MKARAFMGALAMAIAGAGCSSESCSLIPTTTVDSGMLTGTVTGPAALGFPADVHDLGSGQGSPVALIFNAGGGAADGGIDAFQLWVQVYGPGLAVGQSVTLPDRAYSVYTTLTDLTNGEALGKPTLGEGTLTLNGTTSNGTITSEDLIVTLSLICSDGSLIGVDAHLASQFHTHNDEVCTTSDNTEN